MGHRDFDGAILSFNQAVGANNRNAKAYFKRGQCFYYLQNFKLAIDDFTAAIGVDPKNSEFYLWRGATYCKAGDNPHSVMDYEEALRVDPALLKAANGGENKKAEGVNSPMFADKTQPAAKTAQNEQSIQNYLEAVKIVNEGRFPVFAKGTVFGGIIRPEYPSDRESPFLRPDSLEKIMADPKSIMDATRQQLAVNPRDANAHFRKGLALQQMGKAQKAIESLSDAISQEPSNVQYLLARAFLQHQANNDAMSRADMDKARLIDLNLPKQINFP